MQTAGGPTPVAPSPGRASAIGRARKIPPHSMRGRRRVLAVQEKEISCDEDGEIKVVASLYNSAMFRWKFR